MSNIMLTLGTPGAAYTVGEITGGQGVQKRLQDLGIVTGSVITVVQNDRMHPLLIQAAGTVLMIGNGISKKILVSELDSAEQDELRAREQSQCV